MAGNPGIGRARVWRDAQYVTDNVKLFVWPDDKGSLSKSEMRCPDVCPDRNEREKMRAYRMPETKKLVKNKGWLSRRLSLRGARKHW
jgi:hypothetical protein